MAIDKSNYEEYIIDYLDNNLGPVETAELLIYLENHPEINQEFEILNGMKVNPTNEKLDLKELLYQPSDTDATLLNNENYAYYFIAASEGDLSEKGLRKVQEFLHERPSYANEFRLFNLAKVKPAKNIKFPHPSILKRKSKTFFLHYYITTGVAAAILLIATLYFKLTPDTESALEKSMQKSIEFQQNGSVNRVHTHSVKKEPVKKNQAEESVTPGNDIKSEKEKPSGERQSKVNEPKSGTPIIKDFNAPAQKLERRKTMLNLTPLIVQNSGTENFYSDLYDDIKLSQELTMTLKEESTDAETAVAKSSNPSGIERAKNLKTGRILSSMVNSGEQMAEQIPERLNGWLIADIGIKGFNFITNNNLIIDRSISDDGKINHLKVLDRTKQQNQY